MGLLDKIILSYETRWWPDNIMDIFLLWKPEDLKISKDDWITKIGGISAPAASNNTLTFWLSGDPAKLVITHIKRLFFNTYLNAENILIYHHQYLNDGSPLTYYQ